MKERKLRTAIALPILFVTAICMLLLYLIANRNMTKMMKQNRQVMGEIMRMTMAEVATPLPPLNLKKMGNM